MRLIWACFFSFLLSIGSVSAHAQSASGAILGDIVDTSGGRLPAAQIKLVNQQTGSTRELISNELGTYRFNALPPAVYTLTVEFPGFKTVSAQNVTVNVASEVKVDFKLEVAASNETITVNEEAVLVQTTENAVKTIVDNRKIEELPLKTRDFLDLTLLSPGVVSDQGSARAAQSDSISFGGMSEAYKSIWLEGVDFNDEITRGGSSRSAATRAAIGQEAIQEFQVMANSYSAEFGRSASGAINVVTKSGGNIVHGSAFYFRRDDAFERPNYFARNACAANANSSACKPPFETQQFGATIGGPIRKDKTHYFLSYERRMADRSATVNIPAAIKTYVASLGYDTRNNVPIVSRVNNILGKLSYTISPHHSLTMTYLFDQQKLDGQNVGAGNAGDNGADDDRSSWMVVGNLTSLFGQNKVNELRLSAGNQQLYRNYPKGFPIKPEIIFPTVRFGSSSGTPQWRFQRNLILTDTFSQHITGFGGQHDLKYGFEAQKIPSESGNNTGPTQGQFTFLNDAPVVAGNNASLPYLYRAGIDIRGLAHPCNLPEVCKEFGHFFRAIQIYSTFVNDTFRVSQNLTLNLGIRYDLRRLRQDLNGAPFPNNVDEFDFWKRMVNGDLRGKNIKPLPTDKTNISPRFGFSWDPFHNGKTVVRGGYGFYYDTIATTDLRTTVAGYPGLFWIPVANDSRLTGRPNSFFPNVPDPKTLPEEGSTTFNLPTRTTRHPYTQQAAIGIQRQITPSIAITGDFVHMFGLRFPRTRNVNARMGGPTGPFPVIASGTRLILADYGNIIKIRQLQIRLEKRFSKGLAFLLGYTNGSAYSFANSPVDKYNMDADWGPTSNDVKHRIVSNLTYALPFGFQVGAVYTFNTAPPYNVTLGRDVNGDGDNNERPDGMAFNGAREDQFSTMDLRTSKIFKVREKSIEVLWEMFNVFNTVNLGSYVGNQRSVLFGQPQLAFDPFQAQLGMKFKF